MAKRERTEVEDAWAAMARAHVWEANAPLFLELLLVLGILGGFILWRVC